jgi:hypothetical protein
MPSIFSYCKAVSIKAEVLSDAEEEECPVPVTLPGIKQMQVFLVL